jgi:hypothetical protein
VSGLSDRLDKDFYTKAQIDVTAGAIRQEVSAIEVGGRNIISKELMGDAIKDIVSNDSFSGFGYICPSGTNTISVFGQSKPLGLKRNRDYTISFKAWSANTYSICWDLWVLPSVGDEGELPQAWFTTSTEPQLYTWTFKRDVDFIDKAELRFFNADSNGIAVNVTTPIYITDIKIEEGNKRTDWTPAVQDMASVDFVKGSLALEIKSENGKYYSELSSNVDRIDFKSGQITIQSDKFTLDKNGNATFGGTLNAATGSFSGNVTANYLNASTGGILSGWKFDSNSMQYGTLGNANSMWLCTTGTQSTTANIAGSGTTNGWCIGVADKFGVTNTGAVWCSDIHASGGSFEGAITATSLTLKNTKINSSDVSGLSNVATSGRYTDLSGRPDLSLYATNEKLNNYVQKSTLTDKLNGYATTGALDNYLKTGDLSAKLGDLKVAYRGDVTTTQTKNDTTGIITTTSTYIGADGKKYTTTTYSSTDGKYVLLNRDNQWGANDSLVKITKEGLLEANNAIIKGTVYAIDGEFRGTIHATGGDIGGVLIGSLAKKSEIPTNVSDLNNDKNFATTGQLPTKTSQLTNDSDFKDTAGVKSVVDADYISTLELEVGKQIKMGDNAIISWENVDGKPTILTDSQAKEITRTVITSEEITAPKLKVDAANITGTLTVNNSQGKTLFSAGGNSVYLAGFTAGRNDIGGNLYLSTGGKTYNSDYSKAGVYLGTDGIGCGSTFSVSNEGYLYATHAKIEGNITAKTGFIGNLKIEGNNITAGDSKSGITIYSAFDSTNGYMGVTSAKIGDWRFNPTDKAGAIVSGGIDYSLGHQDINEIAIGGNGISFTNHIPSGYVTSSTRWIDIINSANIVKTGVTTKTTTINVGGYKLKFQNGILIDTGGLIS